MRILNDKIMGEDLYDEYEEIDTEDGVYVWTTNGGCPICDALEGEYDEEPTRPHELCDCEITFVRNILSGDGIYWFTVSEDSEVSK